jgi:microcystin-dependent protein
MIQGCSRNFKYTDKQGGKTMRRHFVALTLVLAVVTLFAVPGTVKAQEPFIGEIRLFAGNFAPRGWAFCNGQLLAISQNSALFAILGTTYGGDGRTTFALPDLRGRAPVHSGFSQGPGLTRRNLGEKGGQENVTLSVEQVPSHTHAARASGDFPDSSSPAGNFLGTMQRTRIYSSSGSDVSMATGAIGPAGENQPHNNMPPYLGLNYIIALQGLFPPRN